MKKLLISFLLFLLAFVGRADASIRTVCASGCDYSTVQTAYTAALSGDELVISPGTYTETTNLSLSLDKNITIRGASGNAADVTITASATNQVIYIGANGVSITIKDLTISGAAASGRGQIEHRSYSTNLILDNVIFTDTAGNAIPNLLLGAGSTGSGRQISLNNVTMVSKGYCIQTNSQGGSLSIASSTCAVASVPGAYAGVQVAGVWPTITIATSTITQTAAGAYGLRLIGATVTNLTVSSSTISATASPVSVEASSNITNARLINDNSFTVGLNGSALTPSSNSTVSNLEIDDNVITGNLNGYASIIHGTVSSYTFSNNRVTSAGGVYYNPALVSAPSSVISGNIFSEVQTAITAAGKVGTILVKDNRIIRTSDLGGTIIAFGNNFGHNANPLGAITFHDNTIYNTSSLDGHNLLIGVGADNGTYYNNYSFTDYDYSLVIKGDNNSVYNNIIVGPKALALKEGKNNTIKNTTFITLPGGVQGAWIYENYLSGTPAFTGATWSEASKTLTKTGAFAAYPSAPHDYDYVQVTGGTGATTGYYRIVSKVSDNAVTLETSIGAGADGQTNIAGQVALGAYGNSMKNIVTAAYDNVIPFMSGASNYTTKNTTANYNLYYTNGSSNIAQVQGNNYGSIGALKIGWATLYPASVYENNDQNSTSSDPLFANASGNYSAVSDFLLLPFSPAIDSGTDLGLTADYLGNPIYGVPDLGAYEYQPPYDRGDPVPTDAAIRVYGDEKWRVKTATSSADTADLEILIAEADKTDWLDVVVSRWLSSGTYEKTFTASTTASDVAATFTVGDLVPHNPYVVAVDGAVGANIIGADCTAAGVCTADSNGRITFSYSGGWSTHEFDVLGDGTGPLRSSGAPNSSQPAETTQTTISLITDEPVTCRYSTTPGTSYASMINSFTTTGGTTHSTAVSGLTAGQSYTYYVRCIDASANANESDYGIFFSVASAAHTCGSTLARRQAAQNLNLAPASPKTTVSQLESKLLLLQDQLRALLKSAGPTQLSPITTSSSPITSFGRNLSLNDRGPDAKRLQIFLNQQGFLVAPQGPGSPGHETETFGYGTQSALIRFQRSKNLPGSGFFGPMTRKVVQSIEE